jgi:DNA-binding NarL/FixJ family response regulator
LSPALKKFRILVADDHSVMLEGLVATLETNYDIAGTFTDGRALVEAATLLRPDAIVLDVAMPLLNGLEAAALIKAALPDVKLLFFTMHSGHAYTEAIRRLGANGYVLKTSPRHELLFALDQVLSGNFYMPPEQPARSGDDTRATHPLPSVLSAREREVLQLIAEGRAAKEIAYMLMITTRTVSFHREKIKQKLRLFSTAELTKYAIEHGLI